MASSSSPLHASFLESSRIPPNRNNENTTTTTDRSSPSFPASGAGSPSTGAPPRGARSLSNSRQKRRLKLRNAGFRGPAIPGRRVTPANTSSTLTTTTWSAASDAENISPLGRMKTYENDDRIGERDSNWNTTRRNDSGVEVLQDIVNSSATRRARPRVTSGKFWSTTNADTSEALVALDNDNDSSPLHPTSTTTNSRSLRVRANMEGFGRRLDREQREKDTNDHIAYLETALAETLKDLDKQVSSSTAKELSDTLRHLRAANRGLHQDLRDWEKRYQDRVSEATEDHRKVEVALRNRVVQLETQVTTLQTPIQNVYAATTDKWHSEKFKTLEAHIARLEIELVQQKDKNESLQKKKDKVNRLLAESTSPAKFDPPSATPGLSRRGRPTSLNVRVPTVGELAMSPDRFSATSPAFSRMRQSPRGPFSPLGQTFSPEVMSPVDNGSESDASFSTSSMQPSDTISRRNRHMRKFEGNAPKPLLLPEMSLSTKRTIRSAPIFESHDGETPFKFPPFESTDGSPHSRRRSSSTESNAAAMSPPPAGLRFDTTDTEVDVDTSLKMFSPTSDSFDDVNDRNFSASTRDSTIGRHFHRNLMDELTAARNSSTSTDNEQFHSDPASTDHASTDDTMNTVIRASPQSSPFDSEVEELPEEGDDNNDADAHAPIPVVDTGSSASRPPSPLYAERRKPVIIQHILQTHASNTSLMSASQASLSTVGIASNSSRSTLDSLRTVLSNLFHSPIDVVKHLVQAAQARMSIPRPLLSIQWWLVGFLFGPMARHGMLGHSSSGTSSEQQSLIEDSPSQDQDVNALSYGTAYQTPETSPSPVVTGSNSMVAGTGKKRASSPSDKNVAVPSGAGAGKVAKHCPHQPRRWKHSPLLWLKFSMCLAVAVGVAFKDGPSSLLKEAVCQACKGKKGNWRKTSRDEPFTPPY
ncbi:hypothetical protein M409DRAFT_53061 [Zasmidium cellare ATCC 36951]|uniref:Uncharacterized protein n=1 Tax=Zasmidium cellare ATCC 36951 TaxID=1080233 RepID=A0A6A6CMV9_ZASCE|nr:uncharacterized protein M409DRAFT_53061 [Zasmidium cellare ATCC 36951]KAF2168371.1 hypothetical protein M409DRAFT_53061 [Zasmidium cellare ATCC 36951]